jgi:hypothetical protein
MILISGFTNGGDDINECAQDPNICENGACENMLGGYRSVIKLNYSLSKLYTKVKIQFAKTSLEDIGNFYRIRKGRRNSELIEPESQLLFF